MDTRARRQELRVAHKRSDEVLDLDAEAYMLAPSA